MQLQFGSGPVKNSIEIVHLVLSSETIPWIERLNSISLEKGAPSSRVIYFLNLYAGIRTALQLGLCPPREIHTSYGLRRPGKKVLYIAHGYKPSILALILYLLRKSAFVIVHHHPPRFWESIKSKRLIHRQIYKLTLEKSIAIQALSKNSEDYLKTQNLSDLSKVKVIGHGFIPFFERSEYQEYPLEDRKEPETRILMVGRLSSEKNYQYALKLLSALESSIHNFSVTILGDGPLRGTMTRLAENLFTYKKVFFLGSVSNPMSFMRSHDLLIHTSKSESYCQVLIEAFSVNLPVLSTRVGVFDELQSLDSRRVKALKGDNLLDDLATLKDYISQIPKLSSETNARLIDDFLKSQTIANCIERSWRFYSDTAKIAYGKNISI